MKKILLYFFLCIQLVSSQLLAYYIPPPKNLAEIQNTKDVDHLLFLIQKRLAIMHEVARTKWNKNLPIENKAREQKVLTDFEEEAKKIGLNKGIITSFFKAQFDAAKEIIKQDFDFWSRHNVGKLDVVLELSDLRSYINQINNEIIANLAKIYHEDPRLIKNCIIDHPLSNRELDHIEDSVWQISIAPLKKL